MAKTYDELLELVLENKLSGGRNSTDDLSEYFQKVYSIIEPFLPAVYSEVSINISDKKGLAGNRVSVSASVKMPVTGGTSDLSKYVAASGGQLRKLVSAYVQIGNITREIKSRAGNAFAWIGMTMAIQSDGTFTANFDY